jgi:hypothetical protein
MTATTSKLGADMTDEQIDRLWDGCAKTDPSFTHYMAARKFARALLARQPAAIDKAAATVYVDCCECAECGHIGINDSHDTDASCGYPCGWTGPSPVEDKCPGCHREGVMGLACPKCSGRYSTIAEARIAATPLANEASKPAAPGMTNGDFHCPACGEAMKGPTFCGSCLWEADTCGYRSTAAPSVEQDERGVCDRYQVLNEAGEALLAANHGEAYEVIYRMMKDARAASTSANVAQGAEEPDCWAILTPNGSRLVSPDEAKGRLDAYPLYTAPTAQTALRRIAHELRTYNPAADEYKGEHIHKVWAREIEALLPAASNGEPK